MGGSISRNLFAPTPTDEPAKAEADCASIITLPAHQHLTKEEMAKRREHLHVTKNDNVIGCPLCNVIPPAASSVRDCPRREHAAFRPDRRGNPANVEIGEGAPVIELRRGMALAFQKLGEGGAVGSHHLIMRAAFRRKIRRQRHMEYGIALRDMGAAAARPKPECARWRASRPADCRRA